MTVEGREGEWIEIKAALSVREQNRVKDALLVMRGDAADERMVQIGASNQALLEAAVVGWCLNDEDGQAVPFKRALIGELDPEDELVDKVLGEIATRFPLGGRKKSGG